MNSVGSCSKRDICTSVKETLKRSARILPMTVFSELTLMEQSELTDGKLLRSDHERINSYPSLSRLNV